MTTPSPVGALQRRLALEHEAVWLASLSAARFAALRDEATAALRRHQRARDALLARVSSAGATPVGPQPAYGTVPRSTDEARDRLAAVASRLCAATLPLVTLGTRGDRTEALTALRASALEAVDWGAAPVAFPGLD
jgi:hypothetical protein